jgi:hypothetical protein
MGGNLYMQKLITLEVILNNPQVVDIFSRAGWLQLFERIQNNSVCFVDKFPQIFINGVARVNNLEFSIMEEIISQVTILDT